jgi:uncharacterized protein (TIGR03790 family)
LTPAEIASLRFRLRDTASIVAVLSLIALSVGSAAGQSADNLLLVINQNSPASVQVGEYYAQKRRVAPDHVVRITTVTTDTLPRAEYESAIEGPIATWLARHGLQDQVLYLVLTKGVPLRVAGTGGPSGTVASVDSELTLLYRRLIGEQPAVLGRVSNPYFLNLQEPTQAKPFTRAAADIYLVTRLDGFTVEEVLKLIDRASLPSQDGKVVLDERATLIDAGGDRWLAQTAERLRRDGHGQRVILESTRELATSDGPAIGYFSWGSNDPSNRRRHFGIPFAPGAIGGMFVSTDGRTFTEPPADWRPGGETTRYGTQSLAADLIRDGIAGVAGHVAEPFLDATIRPQILFPAYLSGFNLAESFYLAMPFLSWQTVVVGDPLCAPFPRKPLSNTDLAPEIDSKTKLPAIFAERRLAWLGRTGMNREALQLALRGQVELQAGQTSEAETSMVRAADLEPRLTAASLQLATMYRERGDHDKAIERYRRVLSTDPRDITALNNLAYSLAEDKQLPQEALPFAERAYRLSPTPLVMDTLAWIHHLLGDNKSAAPLIARALAGAPGNVEVLLHAAFVHEALGDTNRAAQELDAAVKLEPGVLRRPLVAVLRERLKPQ